MVGFALSNLKLSYDSVGLEGVAQADVVGGTVAGRSQAGCETTVATVEAVGGTVFVGDLGICAVSSGALAQVVHITHGELVGLHAVSIVLAGVVRHGDVASAHWNLRTDGGPAAMAGLAPPSAAIALPKVLVPYLAISLATPKS